MADDRELQEQEVDGVDEGVEESTAPSTADEPKAERQPDKSKVNLDDSPEFRQWKSEYDRRLADTERRYQQQLAQQQAALRERELSEMDDYQRLQYELQEERQQKAYMAQRLQEIEVETARTRALGEVSREMGVPVSVLESAQDLNEAWRMAAKYVKNTDQRKAEGKAAADAAKAAARADKAGRNQVDLGTGTAAQTNDWDREYAKAKKTSGRSLFAHALTPQDK